MYERMFELLKKGLAPQLLALDESNPEVSLPEILQELQEMTLIVEGAVLCMQTPDLLDLAQDLASEESS